MSLQRLLSRRPQAERHERAVVRRIGLVDGHKRDVFAFEACSDVQQRALVGHGEDDGKRAGAEVPRTTFSRCVDYLSGLQPYGEVGSDDDVVANGIGLAAFGRVTVVATS